MLAAIYVVISPPERRKGITTYFGQKPAARHRPPREDPAGGSPMNLWIFAGRRTVPLDDELVELLSEHQLHQLEESELARSAWNSSGYVFVDEVGIPCRPDYFSVRFAKLVAISGLAKIRLHDLRHTAASLMLGSGVSVKVVQEMLGHSSPAITLALYAHTTPSMAEKAGEALSTSLLGVR